MTAALALIVGGGVLLLAGLRDRSVLEILQGITSPAHPTLTAGDLPLGAGTVLASAGGPGGGAARGSGLGGGHLTGHTIRGKVSWFTGGATACGRVASRDAGIALNIQPGTDQGWNNPTTDKWCREHARFLVKIGGHQAVLPVIDKGPAGSTGRAIDVTEAGVRALGFSTSNFPTDAVGTATLVA